MEAAGAKKISSKALIEAKLLLDAGKQTANLSSKLWLKRMRRRRIFFFHLLFWQSVLENGFTMETLIKKTESK